MTRRPFRSDRSRRPRRAGLLLTSALAVALSAVPVDIGTDIPVVDWQSALAPRRWRR